MHAHPLTPLPHSLGVQFVLPHSLLSMGLILECGWYTQCHFIEENWYPLSHQVSVAISLLAKSVILCRTSFSLFFFFFVFIYFYQNFLFYVLWFVVLAWSHAALLCTVTISEFICASDLFCLEDSLSLASSTNSLQILQPFHLLVWKDPQALSTVVW